MGWAAQHGADDPLVQDAAALAVAGRRGEAAVSALRSYVARVRYVDDPHPHELIRSPALMVERIEAGGGEGDCDDVATLAAALALSLGWSARFVLLETPPGLDDHVWTDVAPPGGEWWELDTSRPEALPPGWSFIGWETFAL